MIAETPTTVPAGQPGDERSSRAGARSRRSAWREAGGVGAVVAMAIAYLSPALKDGGRYGAFALVMRTTTLGASAYPNPPWNHLASDSVSEMAAWNLFDYQQIHAGHFPLWNNLSLLGLPQFLNFESGVLSLPDLVSYAVPVRFAALVVILVTMLIAGTGAYVLARVLGLSPIGASFAGIAFMLSGPFANWLWNPLSVVVAWTGWIAAFAVLAYRYWDRGIYVVGLALSVAFCLYGGFPEGNAFVAVVLVVMAAVLVLARLALRRHASSAPGRAIDAGGIFRLGFGIVAGGLLALPLWWPGVQILDLSHRESRTGFPTFTTHYVGLFLTQGYYGLPTGKNAYFLGTLNYYESVSYVGIVMIVLAFVACVRWWRHPSVVALLFGCLVVLATLYSSGILTPLHHLLVHLSAQVYWSRFRSVVGLPLGILAGLGLETLLKKWRSRLAAGAFALASLACGAAIAIMATRHVLPGVETTVRDRSLYWPAATVIACIVVAGCWWAGLLSSERRRRRQIAPGSSRRGRNARGVAVATLFVANAAFLLFAGVGINPYGHSFYPVTPAIAQLRHDIGSSILGLDGGNGAAVQHLVDAGLYPEANMAYGFTEFAGHDPILPQSYFTTLAPGSAKGGPAFFEPDITSASLARRYGIAYIIAAPAAKAPTGTTYVDTLAGERLYKVPGASRFTLAGGGRVSDVRQPTLSEYDVSTSSPAGGGPRTLTVRVTDVPGWHATIDGRPAELTRAGGVMLALVVPAGRHHVRIWYYPERLNEGLVAAGIGAILLVLWCAFLFWRRRRRQVSAHLAASVPDVFSFAPLLEVDDASLPLPGEAEGASLPLPGEA